MNNNIKFPYPGRFKYQCEVFNKEVFRLSYTVEANGPTEALAKVWKIVTGKDCKLVLIRDGDTMYSDTDRQQAVLGIAYLHPSGEEIPVGVGILG